MNTIHWEHAGLRELSLADQERTSGGNPIAIAIGAYAAACTVAYYTGYGAHAVYDYFND